MNDNFDDISEFIDDSEQTGSTFATLKEKLFEYSIDFNEKMIDILFQKNKKMLISWLNVFKNHSLFFFQNPSRTQIVTFPLKQKGCHYLGCHYCEAIQ